MKLIIPMAGRGKRFLDAGEETPKMLIPLHGKPMMVWALSSFHFIAKKDWIFIVLREHVRDWNFDEELRKAFGNVTVAEIPDVTPGQACTVERAKKYYSVDEPIVIHNTDTYFKSTTLQKNLSGLGNSTDGIIGVFKSENPSYSYVELSKDNIVKKVAEKEVISQYATSGLYAFGKAGHFLEALREAEKNKEAIRGEYYVGPLYNKLIKKGLKITVDFCSEIYDLGKPENVMRFNKEPAF